MIKKVLIFFVLVSLCVYALVGCQQPPRDYPDDNRDDDGDGNENTKP